MKKRIISLVLVLAMMLTFVPAGVLASDKSGVTVKYALSEVLYDLRASGVTGVIGDNKAYFSYESTNNFYEIAAISANVTTIAGADDPKCALFEVPKNEWVIFEINVPVAGIYKLRTNNSFHNNSGILKAYISPATVTPISNVVTVEDNYVGKLNCDKNAGGVHGVGGGWGFTVDASQPFIDNAGKEAEYNFETTGKYYIGFKAVAEDGTTGNHCRFADFYLVGGTGKAYMGKYELPEEPLTVVETKTRDISLPVLLSDGTWAKADISNCVSADEGVATVTNSGKVRGVELGNTTVSFDASYGGVSVGNFQLPVKVVENDGITIKYDLAKLYSAISTNTDKTFAGNITYENTDGFFKYKSDSRNDAATKNYHLRWKGNGMFELYQGNWLFLEINVPKSGDYDISMYNGKALLGGDVSVYVLKSNGEKPGAADLKDDNFVGTIHCDDSTVAAGKVVKVTTPTPVGSHYFDEAGKYYIGFQALDTDAVPDPLPEGDNVANYADSAYVGDIVMRSGDNRVVMKSYPKTETLTLAINQQAKLSAYALLSDVSETELSCTDFEIADGGEGIVSVSESGEVTALAEGETSVFYTASYKNSYATSFETKIKVASGGGISIKYDIEGDMNRLGWDSIRQLGDLKKLTDEHTNGFYRYFNAPITTWSSGMLRMDNFILIADGRHVSFEVYVPQAGVYDLSVNHSAFGGELAADGVTWNDLGIFVDVFVNRSEVSTSEKDLVGTYDCYKEGVTNRFQAADTPSYVGKVVIPERGYYVFTFRPDDRDGVSRNWIWGSIGTFTLTSGNEAVLAGVFPGTTPAENEMLIISVDSNELFMTDPEHPATKQVKAEIVPATDGKFATKQISAKQFGSSSNRVASVSQTGVVTAAMEGDVNITVKATVDGKMRTATLPLNVRDYTGVVGASEEFIADEELFLNERESTSFSVRMNSGHTIKVPASEVSYSYQPEGIVSVDETGIVSALDVGETIVTATVENFRGTENLTATKKIKVIEHDGKKGSTYYTDEKKENAKKNAGRYAWAKSEIKSIVSLADKYLVNWEKYYSLMVPNGIPSSFSPTYRNDPGWYVCHYCGIDLSGDEETSGHSAFKIDPINRPWKVQCNNCKRLFPSNDFALLYERGRDAEGHYDVNRAIEANAEAVRNGEKDALKNDLYPEVETATTINYNQGLREGESVYTWGVDDGFGYRPLKPDGTPYMSGEFKETKLYIAHYLYQFWSEVQGVATTLSKAYVYTGDKRYGLAGAALVDKWADTYHQHDLTDYDDYGGQGTGYTQGRIGECAVFEAWSLSADAVYPMIFESDTINFLKKKAEHYELANDKSGSEKIWANWKDNILLETYIGAKTGRIDGNFGFAQAATTAAAIVLAEEPMRTEIIDWVMRSGRHNDGDIQGGNVLKNLVNTVDRDGQANEVAANYNSYQMKALERVAEYLLTYAKDGKRNYNLFDFPKYSKMFEPWNALQIMDNQQPNLGDSGGIGTLGFYGAGEAMVTNFMSLYALNNPDTESILKETAQFIYRWKGYNLEEIRTSIFDEEPEAVQDVLKDYISGEQPLTRSDILPGYGFAVLRDGTKYNSASTQSKVNTQRDFWMYFGPTIAAHSHADALRIGVDAFGFSVAPDFGYPANAGKFPQRLQWDSETISGNTVSVNDDSQVAFSEGATPYHYDDSGIVKLIDAEALGAYKTTVDDLEHYRRTVVMVKVDEDNSYGIDFFRVKGGESHLFSFYGAAEHVNAVEGLGECIPQVDENGEYIGSYVGMGPDGKGAPYTDAATGETKYYVGPGQDPNSPDAWYYDTVFPRGHSWLGKVRRYKTPDEIFSVEFDIEDYRKTVENNKGIKLRLTQMNSFTPEEVAFAAGPKPDKPENAVMPKTFDFLLVRNEKQAGEDTLDSLFTTVYEPYQYTRYLKSIEPISTISAVEGIESEDDVVRAVKVTHEKDRTDYIIYATNNSVIYKLTDGDREIYFKGFVGMYSVNSLGEVLYRYVNDGTVIGENAPVMEKTAYTGTVKDFDMTFDFGDFDNWIDVNIDCDDPKELAGKVIYIENDGVQSGAYEIVDAWKNEDGSTRIDLGSASIVRSYADEYDIDGGYIYNIDVKQSFRIPLAYVETGAPEFDSVGELTTSAGSTLKVKITAHSPLEKAITYSGTKIPRGASVNEATGEITWKPDSSQVGENHFEITAIDSDGRESAIHFIVTVYGATTGSSGNKNEDNSESSSENAGTTGGGGGGGGGGAAPTDKPDGATDTD
ncbi:MAG: putative Ig domain-containing protein, partial [Oscillospiraceae bacterium]|nr:putative Ig domain-containing protein [Oscillospiraceae bacterium]